MESVKSVNPSSHVYPRGNQVVGTRGKQVVVDTLTHYIHSFISYGISWGFLCSESVKTCLDGFLTDLTHSPLQVAYGPFDGFERLDGFLTDSGVAIPAPPVAADEREQAGVTSESPSGVDAGEGQVDGIAVMDIDPR